LEELHEQWSGWGWKGGGVGRARARGVWKKAWVDGWTWGGPVEGERKEGREVTLSHKI